LDARHIPNLITVFRILLVIPVNYFLLERRFGLTLGLFILAGLSDGLDGFLAKQYHWQSRLGSYLDPLADKLLLVSSFLSLAWMGLIPVWLTFAVVLRDVVILTGAIAYYFLLKPFEGQPHWTSKLNTFFQLILVVSVLFSQGVWPVADGLLFFLILVVFVTSLLSGAIYVQVWGSRYWRETHPSR
jgi:cardiolipin synthase